MPVKVVAADVRRRRRDVSSPKKSASLPRRLTGPWDWMSRFGIGIPPPCAGHYPQALLLDDRAVLSAPKGGCFAVPKGQARIAQRFNAGLDARRSRVPKGRLRSSSTPIHSAVPSGLV